MEGVTKEQIKQDYQTIRAMWDRYKKGVWGTTTHRPGDLEQQHKHVRIAVPVVTAFLKHLCEHLSVLADDSMPIVEDED